MNRTEKTEEELGDYEYINGILYIKAKSLVKAITGMLVEEDYAELLSEGLGLDEEGNRI